MKKYSLDSINNRGYLSTEQPNENSFNLDELNTSELVDLFSKEDLLPQKAVSMVLPELTKSIDYIVRRLENNGRLFYLGAGTSGRLGVLDASECPPTFCTPPELVQGLIAGGFNSLVNSSEGLEDDENISLKDLKERNFCKNDCLIGITSGGTTPYVISALKHSLNIGALTIAISSVSKTECSIPADIDIRLITGPELLAGSTRLKSGTATKMALNIISTCTMVKLGKVYKNRMVDVSAKNKKLLDRSIRILCDICSLDRESALELIYSCEGSLKLAIFKSFTGLETEACREILSKNKNMLNKALKNI